MKLANSCISLRIILFQHQLEAILNWEEIEPLNTTTPRVAVKIFFGKKFRFFEIFQLFGILPCQKRNFYAKHVIFDISVDIGQIKKNLKFFLIFDHWWRHKGGSKLNFGQKLVVFHLWGPGFPGFWPIFDIFLFDHKTLVNFENFDMRDVMMTSSHHGLARAYIFWISKSRKIGFYPLCFNN